MDYNVNVDVEDVKFVINYDYPNCSEDYVHRIGRTGRSQKKGTAYTFFTHSNSKQAKDLIEVLREANQVVNPKLYEMQDSSRGYGGGGGRGGYGGRVIKFVCRKTLCLSLTSSVLVSNPKIC